MRLIDADSIKYHRTTECGGHGVFLDVDMVYKEEIDAIPTIDDVKEFYRMSAAALRHITRGQLR